ncbi:MAG: CpaD family pilus assembly lipoprotein, partial [Stellaceae bacterium]
LKLDTATTQLDLRFAPGSASLAAIDASRLRRAAATGAINPSDRVTVGVAGAPYLAKQRFASVSALLLHYGIVPVAGAQDAPPNHAIVAVQRTLVTLPPCPNWSKRPNSDFDNQPSSNFGCATETDLGMMVANPTDLASGLPLGPTAGQPAAAAVNRYLNDKVELPTANTALPVAAQSSSQGSNQGSGAGAGAGTSGSQ